MKRAPIWLVLIYCMAHAPLLLTTGWFLDDFPCRSGGAHLVAMELWADGRPLYGYCVNFIMGLDNDLIARFLSFSAYLLAGLLLYWTLKNVKVVDDEARFFIVAFFMLFPADSTRVSLTWTYYGISYLLFFVGFWCLSRYMVGRNLWWRLAALASFFVSFFLPSLLVLFALAVLYIAYNERAQFTTISDSVAVMARYADFVALPVTFWLVRMMLFPPMGPYAGYFQFSLAGFSPLHWAIAVRGSLVRPMLYSLTPVHVVQGVLVLGAAYLLQRAFTRGLQEAQQDLRRDLVLFATGVFAFILALLPYVIIRKLPEFWDWTSRHALLVPLGVAFMLFYGVRIIGQLTNVRRSVTILAQCLLVCVFMTANVRIYASYWVDWYKCLALAEQFKASDIVRDHTSFLFVDQASDWNAKKRKLRFYEYAGLMQLAFGDQKRFGVLNTMWSGTQGLQGIQDLLKGEHHNPRIPDFARFYCLGDWVPRQPEYTVKIVPVVPELSPANVVRMKAMEFLDPTAFRLALNQLVRLEFDETGTQSRSP